MSKFIKHDPRPQMDEKQKALYKARFTPLLEMSDADVAAAVAGKNLSQPELQALVGDLVQTVRALSKRLNRLEV